MTDLTTLTIAEARAGLAGKEFSAAELTDAHLSAMERARSLNAFVLETPEAARAMAKAADARLAAGTARALEGIPIAVKDMFCTAGVRTTACSRILEPFVPTYDSTVTSTLWRDAAILLRSMAGHDPKDTTSADRPVPDYEAAVGRAVKGMRIGIPKEYRVEGMAAEIEALWEQGRDWLTRGGAEMVEVSLPHTKY